MTQRQSKFSFLSLMTSFLLAVGLWVYVSMNSQYTTVVDLPLFVTLPENRAIETPIPQAIRAQVRGVGWQLFNLNFSFPPRCVVTVNDEMLGPEQTTFKLTRKLLEQGMQLPDQVEPLGLVPDSLVFQVGRVSRKRVPVYPVLAITLRKGFITTGVPHVEPDSVDILGNRNILDRIKYWKTKPITLANLYKPVSITASLSDSLANITQLSRSVVSVYVDVQQIAEMTFDNVPVELLSAPGNHNILIQPSSVSLTVRGGINQISVLNQNDIKVYVDYSEVVQNTTGILIPRVSLPPDINVLNLAPARVRYVRRISAQTASGVTQ